MKLIAWSEEILDSPSRFFEPLCMARKSAVNGNQLFMSQPSFNQKLIQMAKYLCFFICVCSFLQGCQDEVNSGPIEELFFEPVDSLFFYSDYDFISSEDLDVKFFDGFDNNENEWSQVDDRDYLIDISNGKLVMESRTNKLRYVLMGFIGFFSDDFQIEIDCQFSDFYSDQSCILRWGGINRWEGNFGFRISQEGYYLIEHRDGGEWQDRIIRKTLAKDIIKKRENKLTIRQIRGIHYFFINEIFVGKVNNMRLKGNEFGPSVGPYSRCDFDNLKVGFLN